MPIKPIDLAQVHRDHLTYLERSRKNQQTEAIKNYTFLLNHEAFLRNVANILDEKDDLRLSMIIAPHMTVYLERPTKSKISALVVAFETEFGDVESDEIDNYGTNGFVRTLAALKQPNDPSLFWAPQLTIQCHEPKCTIIYEEVEVPATTKKVIKRVNCPEDEAEAKKEAKAEDEDLSFIPSPSGDEDQPRRESNEAPF